MRDSARRSSRSAPTSRIRPRSGSTGMSGSSGRPPVPGWGSPRCPTGSPPATIRLPCRRSVTGCSLAPSRCSPSGARGFFEALVADNLDIGRPHNVEIIFGRRVRRDTGGTFRTAIDRRDNGGVIVNVFYKHSRIKQYLKDSRAMRIETVVNAPRDLGCNARLPNLEELQAKARAANRRILDAERA